MDELFTTDEVAARLKCSAQTIRTLVHDGKLKATHVGSRMRFRVGDVEQFLREQEGTNESQ